MKELIPERGAFTTMDLEVTRELTQADVMALANVEEKIPVAPLQRLRAIHQRQARLLASGKTNREVALLTGSTPERIYQLLKMPAFTDLVSYYHDQVVVLEVEDAQRIQGKLTDIAEMAVDEILERVEDDNKRKMLPMGELRKLTELGADRTVAPPKTATDTPIAPPTTITFNIGNRPLTPQLPKPIEPQTIDITPAKSDPTDSSGS